MKLAEALLSRADSKKRLEFLKSRMEKVAKIQEGDKPSENPLELLAEYDRLLTSFTELVVRINQTNIVAKLDNGMSLTEAIAQRDALTMKWHTYKSLIDEAAIKQDRYTRSEVRFVATVDVADLQKRSDDIAKQRRDLDFQIQAANWQADLV